LARLPACFVGGECVSLQAVVAAHSATALGWHRLLAQAAPSSRVGSDGSAFTRRIYGRPEAAAAAEVAEVAAASLDRRVPLKRYLCKWRGVSHLHLSWETAASLRLVLGATRSTQALSGFASKGGDDAFLNDFGLHLDLDYADCDLTDDAAAAGEASAPPAHGASGAGVPVAAAALRAGGRRFTNALYVTPERVLAVDPPLGETAPAASASSAGGAAAAEPPPPQQVLVKWCGLPYGCATWEKAAEVPGGKAALAAFAQRSAERASGSGTRDGRSRKGKKNKVRRLFIFAYEIE
jgi:hypothetical protein